MEELLAAMQPDPTEVEDAPAPVVHRAKLIKAKSPALALPTQGPVPLQGTPEKRPRPSLTWGIAPKSAVAGSAVQFKDGNDAVDATIGTYWDHMSLHSHVSIAAARRSPPRF